VAERAYTVPRSALVSSLESLLQRFEGQPAAALVVFTDGNATDAARLEELIARQPGVPVYPVLLGLRESPKDLAMEHVEVTQTPFEDSPVVVTARVSARGFGKEEISLLLRDEEGKTVHTEKHLLPEGAEVAGHTFQARFRPAKMGLSFYTVLVVRTVDVPLLEAPDRLAHASGEAVAGNNKRLLAVDRKAGPYRVLYVGGRPNWEYKFLRRALELDPEVKLVSLIRMARKEPKFQWRGREGEMSNPLFRGFGAEGGEAQRYDQPVIIRMGISDKQELADGFPRRAEDLFGSFRAVILDDVEAGFFTQEQMDLLEKFVSVRGGSLLMLGGQESFRLGGYEHTPVGRMLPVYLDSRGAASPVQNAVFNLTREGWLEPWMRLRNTEGEEESRLANMPPFYSVNQSATAIKPGASILATVTDPEQKSHPAWVVQRYGSGRVGAVTVGDVWRWGMRDAESRMDMEKAWRQILRWLVVDVPDRVEIEAVLAAAGSHERVTPQIRVRDSAFRPQDDASVKLEIVEADGAKLSLGAEPSASEAGLFEGMTHAIQSGAYRVKATVQDGSGAVVGEATTGWALNPEAEEFASLTPNRPFLEKIARWSGGRVLELGELDAWAAQLPKAALPLMEVRSEPLWNRWWVLVLLVALLGTEWWLRRRQGWR
jgi:uncharacterized membrane protein